MIMDFRRSGSQSVTPTKSSSRNLARCSISASPLSLTRPVKVVLKPVDQSFFTRNKSCTAVQLQFDTTRATDEGTLEREDQLCASSGVGKEKVAQKTALVLVYQQSRLFTRFVQFGSSWQMCIGERGVAQIDAACTLQVDVHLTRYAVVRQVSFIGELNCWCLTSWSALHRCGVLPRTANECRCTRTDGQVVVERFWIARSSVLEWSQELSDSCVKPRHLQLTHALLTCENKEFVQLCDGLRTEKSVLVANIGNGRLGLLFPDSKQADEHGYSAQSNGNCAYLHCVIVEQHEVKAALEYEIAPSRIATRTPCVEATSQKRHLFKCAFQRQRATLHKDEATVVGDCYMQLAQLLLAESCGKQLISDTDLHRVAFNEVEEEICTRISEVASWPAPEPAQSSLVSVDCTRVIDESRSWPRGFRRSEHVSQQLSFYSEPETLCLVSLLQHQCSAHKNSALELTQETIDWQTPVLVDHRGTSVPFGRVSPAAALLWLRRPSAQRAAFVAKLPAIAQPSRPLLRTVRRRHYPNGGPLDKTEQTFESATPLTSSPVSVLKRSAELEKLMSSKHAVVEKSVPSNCAPSSLQQAGKSSSAVRANKKKTKRVTSSEVFQPGLKPAGKSAADSRSSAAFSGLKDSNSRSTNSFLEAVPAQPAKGNITNASPLQAVAIGAAPVDSNLSLRFQLRASTLANQPNLPLAANSDAVWKDIAISPACFLPASEKRALLIDVPQFTVDKVIDYCIAHGERITNELIAERLDCMFNVRLNQQSFVSVATGMRNAGYYYCCDSQCWTCDDMQVNSKTQSSVAGDASHMRPSDLKESRLHAKRPCLDSSASFSCTTVQVEGPEQCGSVASKLRVKMVNRVLNRLWQAKVPITVCRVSEELREIPYDIAQNELLEAMQTDWKMDSSTSCWLPKS